MVNYEGGGRGFFEVESPVVVFCSVTTMSLLINLDLFL